MILVEINVQKLWIQAVWSRFGGGNDNNTAGNHSKIKEEGDVENEGGQREFYSPENAKRQKIVNPIPTKRHRFICNLLTCPWIIVGLTLLTCPWIIVGLTLLDLFC